MSDPVAEQKRYYAERAPEYDDWWYRRGRYELEPEALGRWQADIAEAEAALEEFAPGGTVLELAAGTGIWTRKLVRLAERVVAVDANAETLALNTSDAELVRADVFEWEPAERFDLVFFSFWLSHVPRPRFSDFWSLVRSCLEPGGRVFLIDNREEVADSYVIRRDSDVELRRVHDGGEFQVVEVFYEPEELQGLLGDEGWRASIDATRWFIYGDALPG